MIASISSLLLLAPLAFAANVDRVTLAARQSACTDTHIFLAKGNNEPYPGRQGAIVNAVCDGLASCDYEDILFYNPVESEYCGSVNQGVADGQAQIVAYNQRCPKAKLVLSGYSQGAQVITDILGGAGGIFFQNCVENEVAPLDINSAAGKQIAAAMVFGNTRHTANQPYNVLTGSGKDGLFPRTGAQYNALLKYTSVFHDYCVITDPICAGGKIVADHLNYFEIYTNEAAAWVKSQLLAFGASTSTSSSIVPVTTSTAVTAPYPTATGYSNSTMSVPVSIIVIPTMTRTVIVTVPCAAVNTAALSSLSTFPVTHATTTGVVGSGSSATTTAARVTPTGSSPSNGTATFTGAAGQAASVSLLGMFSVLAAGVVSLML